MFSPSIEGQLMLGASYVYHRKMKSGSEEEEEEEEEKEKKK